MWQEIVAALALAMVLEGILPFLSPGSAREAYRTLAEKNDGALRTIGLVVMLIGVVVLALVKS